MNQLVPFGIGADKVLNAVSTISNNYFRYKLIRGESINNVPYLIGNSTETLMMTNNLLSLAKDFTGNFPDSFVPSFEHLITNHTRLVQAQTAVAVSQNALLNNRLIYSQGVTISGGTLLTCMSACETIYSTNMFSRVCFAGATVLNGLGTACSVAHMMTAASRSLSPLGCFFNGLGIGCFYGAKYCQNLGRITKFRGG